MAMHTQNLQADPRASLFVTEPDAGDDPLFDGHVLDVVLAVFPALHMRLFSHDEGAQVAAIEHDHVGQTLLGSGRCSGHSARAVT